MNKERRKDDDFEQRYYDALFTGNVDLAKRIFRIPELQERWNPERLRKEAQKCGVFDQAEKEEIEEHEQICNPRHRR